MALAVGEFWAAPWLSRGYGLFARFALAPTREAELSLQVRHLAQDDLLERASRHRRRPAEKLVPPGLAKAAAEQRDAGAQVISAQRAVQRGAPAAHVVLVLLVACVHDLGVAPSCASSRR